MSNSAMLKMALDLFPTGPVANYLKPLMRKTMPSEPVAEIIAAGLSLLLRDPKLSPEDQLLYEAMFTIQ